MSGVDSDRDRLAIKWPYRAIKEKPSDGGRPAPIFLTLPVWLSDDHALDLGDGLPRSL
jgi:hypothetical protein